MDKEQYLKLEAEAIRLVEQFKLTESELDQVRGQSRSANVKEKETRLLEKLRLLQEAKMAFETNPGGKKLLANVDEEFERQMDNIIVKNALAPYNGGAEARRLAAEASLKNNAERIAKDPTNGYRSEVVVNNSSRKRRSKRSKRSRTTRSY